MLTARQAAKIPCEQSLREAGLYKTAVTAKKKPDKKKCIRRILAVRR